MLIRADDYALAATVEHYEQLKNMLHVACPPPEIVRGVLDKASTLEAAQQAGFQYP